MADQKNRQFKVIKFLGKGSYGSVFLVQRLADSQTYALKEMDVRSMSQAEREDSINEIRLLASINHPNVIAYNEAFVDGNRLCIIMEYAADGDLAKLIKKHQMMKRPIPEDTIWRFFIQVAMGIQALHSMKILHRDIKPGNIMIFENNVAKVGDLGIAKLLTKTAAAKTQIGTPHYMPPEIWKSRPYGFSSDTWALGCLLYEMATLTVPFEARSMSELRYKVLRGTYPPIPGTYSRDLQQLVRDCLDPNPDRRPSLDHIMAGGAVTARMGLLPQQSRHPPATAGGSLIETIKVPRGNIAAIKNKLPPANYATDMINLGLGNGVGAQMATIDEASEEDTLPSRPQALPPMRPPVGPPKPSYAPPAPPPLRSAQAQVPQLPQLPNLGPAGQYLAKHGGVGGRPPALLQQAQMNAMAVAQQQQQRSAMETPVSSNGGGAGPPAWYQPSKQSESHASYGAFYHNSNVPSGYGTPQSGMSRPPQAAQQQQQHQPSWQQQAAAKWQAQQALQAAQAQYAAAAAQQRQQQQYASPYSSPYGAPRENPRLPQLNAAPRMAPQQQQQQQQLREAKPPPWNYGGAAKRAPPRAAPSGGRLPALGGGGDDVQRYPPPQWVAKPAARW